MRCGRAGESAASAATKSSSPKPGPTRGNVEQRSEQIGTGWARECVASPDEILLRKKFLPFCSAVAAAAAAPAKFISAMPKNVPYHSCVRSFVRSEGGGSEGGGMGEGRAKVGIELESLKDSQRTATIASGCDLCTGYLRPSSSARTPGPVRAFSFSMERKGISTRKWMTKRRARQRRGM